MLRITSQVLMLIFRLAVVLSLAGWLQHVGRQCRYASRHA